MKGSITLALTALLLAPYQAKSISVYSETFTAPSSNTWSFGSGVPINTSVWSTYTNGNHGARITNGRLEVTSRRSSSAHGQGFAYVACGGPGSQYDNSVYNPVLGANSALVTWTFNMRKSPSSATTNGGFSCSQSSSQNGITIGLGYILATSSASGILSSTNNCSPNGTSVGYAVLHGGNNRIRLVRFENSIHNGTITNIAESQTVNYSNYHSVRVTYDPGTNAWTLAVRSDGTGSFGDPTIGTYPSTATGNDATYTGVALNFTGGYFQAGCIGNCNDASSGYIALFDNINVDVACVPPPVPGPIQGEASLCAGSSSTYSVNEVPGVDDYVWTYSGTGGQLIPSGSSVELVLSLGATSGVLGVSSFGDCGSAPSTLTITVLGQPEAPEGLSGPELLCTGSSAIYSVNERPGESYIWELPAGWSGGIAGGSISVVGEAPGGAVLVSAVNGCGDGPQTTLDVVVFSLPEVSLPPFGQLCASSPPLTLSGGSPAGGTYTFGGVPITSFDPIVGIGSFPITYTVVDTNGCLGSVTQILEVDACASIGERNMVELQVHPNPVSSGMLYITAPVPGDLVLYDAAGRVALQGWHGADGPSSTLSIDALSPGAYTLVYRTTLGEVGHSRVIVGR